MAGVWVSLIAKFEFLTLQGQVTVTSLYKSLIKITFTLVRHFVYVDYDYVNSTFIDLQFFLLFKYNFFFSTYESLFIFPH